jgi:hypothetical protein
MVGRHQRREREEEDGVELPSPSRRKKVKPIAKVLASPLAACLLLKWAWGTLSAPDLQDMAMAAKLSAGAIDEGVDELSRLGTYGHHRNMKRDLLDQVIGNRLWTPAATSVRIPCIDPTGNAKKWIFTDTSIIFPSDWMRALTSKAELEEMFEYFAGSAEARASFWGQQDVKQPKWCKHPMLKKKGWKKHAVPIQLHGDGARYQHTDSLTTVSMHGLLQDSAHNHIKSKCKTPPQ